jgi:hypothetical protein
MLDDAKMFWMLDSSIKLKRHNACLYKVIQLEVCAIASPYCGSGNASSISFGIFSTMAGGLA